MLKLKSTKKKSIKLLGLSIILSEVVIRYKPYPSLDGKAFEADILYFENVENWKNHSEQIPLNLPIMLQGEDDKFGYINAVLNQNLKEEEEQDHPTYHKYLKEVFEKLGYECESLL